MTLRHNLHHHNHNHNHNHHKTTTIHTVPSLDDILNDELNYGYYSKQNFIEYLQSIHCLENLSFVLALNNYMINPTIWKWKIIYQEFLSPNSINEINLPANLKANLKINHLPSINAIVDLKKYVYNDILLDLYLEFIKLQKNKLMVNPDIIYNKADDVYDLDDVEVFSRHNSIGNSSRGSSIGSFVEGFKRRLRKS